MQTSTPKNKDPVPIQMQPVAEPVRLLQYRARLKNATFRIRRLEHDPLKQRL